MSVDTFLIREAQPEDAQLIYQFICGIAQYEKLLHEVEATVDSVRTSLFGKDSVTRCLLAFEGENPVGFAVYFLNYSTFLSRNGLYLEDLFVDPAYRGRGYGKALFMKLVSIAAINNYGRMEWSVLNWNEPAIEFYKSMGAEANSGWTVYKLTEDKLKALATEVQP